LRPEDSDMQNTTRRIVRGKAALAVIDIQERLLPVMHEKERVVQNALRLIRAAVVMKLPVVATEQYRKGVGATTPEIAAAIPGFAPLEKLAFSCCGADGFVKALRDCQATDIVLCGIEAHVCVTQTCLDLLDQGFRPFVVTDAISSRTPENCRAGEGRMRDAGAVMVTTEMILFELLGRAGTDEFKQILPLVK
jgi:nicotinamidase-related amidase